VHIFAGEALWKTAFWKSEEVQGNVMWQLFVRRCLQPFRDRGHTRCYQRDFFNASTCFFRPVAWSNCRNRSFSPEACLSSCVGNHAFLTAH
jgi:hypothetical protein